MQLNSRKEINVNIRRLEEVLRIVRWSEDLYDASEFRKQLLEKISELKSKLESLPIGHEYTGVYYKRSKDGWIKEEGTLFMREDLMSWVVPGQRYPYLRHVHIEPVYNKHLTREHGVPVFQNER